MKKALAGAIALLAAIAIGCGDEASDAAYSALDATSATDASAVTKAADAVEQTASDVVEGSRQLGD